MRLLPGSRAFPVFLFAILTAAASVHGESCSIAQPHPLTPEQLAMIGGNYTQAEVLYRAEIEKTPNDQELTAALARTLLAEQKTGDAESTIRTALAADPQSPVLLTALAEVQYREGVPWDEAKTLGAAQVKGVCYPKLHLAFSKFYRLNSYYASAQHEIQVAYRLDPFDPAIRRAWVESLPLGQRIAELKKYLATHDSNQEAMDSAKRELAYLENRVENQTNSCHLASGVTATDIDFTPILIDMQHIRGWGLDVAFNGHKSRLEVDTGAGGLYISRSVAEHAGLKPVAKSEIGGIGDKGAQSGYTAYADSIKIGGLEFKNCLVEVSDRRNVAEIDGLIGMDVFSAFLVTLDFPWHKLTLSPLPVYPGATAAPASLNTEQASSPDEKTSDDKSADASSGSATGPKSPSGPHDRYIAPEMEKWTKVYRVGHQLMVPTALNKKTMHLFIMDTGAFRTSISPAAASEVTKVRSDDYSGVHGISGSVKNVSRGDKVIVQFAGLQQETDGMLSFDNSGISRGIGVEVSGFLGFDVLHLLVVKIDYRDGLVSFDYSEDRGYQHIR
jgi:predicted aspartyl protease